MDTSLFASLGAVASLINASSDLDQTLKHLLEAACRRPPWSAGGIMYVDTDRGYAHVVVRHDPSGLGGSLGEMWPLSESPARIAVERNEPVIIRDAQQSTEFPGYRREATQRGYRSVIILPMDYRNREGHPVVLSLRSREAVDMTPDELAFLQLVVHLGQIAMDKARSLAEEQAFGERLHAALLAHSSLLDQVLADESEAAVTTVGALLPTSPVIVDLTARRVATSRSPIPELISDQAWRVAMTGDLSRQFLDIAAQKPREHRFDIQDIELTIEGTVHRLPAIVCPLTVDRTQVGALIVLSPTPGFGDLDHLLLDSIRFGLSVQMMRSYVAAVTEARNLEELFADLLGGGRPLPDIVDRARRLHIDLARPARLIILEPASKLPEAAVFPLRRELTHIARRFDPRTMVTLRDGAIVVLCPTDRSNDDGMPDLAQRMGEEVRVATGAPPIIMLGKLCRAPADYLSAWRDCERLRGLAKRFGRSGLVRPEDFGPFPVLMSAVDTGEMDGFVATLVGPIAAHDRTHGTAYIRTLSTFLDHGCRIQATADVLGIHVTTLRYRLDRLGDLFGVAMDTPEQRFALQLALQFDRILHPSAIVELSG